jgi:hypothetical protein
MILNFTFYTPYANAATKISRAEWRKEAKQETITSNTWRKVAQSGAHGVD